MAFGLQLALIPTFHQGSCPASHTTLKVRSTARVFYSRPNLLHTQNIFILHAKIPDKKAFTSWLDKFHFWNGISPRPSCYFTWKTNTAKLMNLKHERYPNQFWLTSPTPYSAWTKWSIARSVFSISDTKVMALTDSWWTLLNNQTLNCAIQQM